MTAEDVPQWMGSQRFPVTPGDWKSQLMKDVTEEIPQAGDPEQASLAKITRALMTMMPGGRPAGPGTTGVFGSSQAIRKLYGGDSEPSMLNEYHNFLDKGYSHKSIWNSLGVARGIDGRLRVELGPAVDPSLYLPLHRAVLGSNDAFHGQVGSVMYPHVANIYPKVADAPLVLLKSTGNPTGSYTPGTGKIKIGPSGSIYKHPLDAIEHEIQHGIQDTEGLARGSNFNLAPPITPTKEYLERAVPLLTEFLGPEGTKEWLRSPEDFRRLLGYLVSAGEVEARNAGRRAVKPELQKLLPSATEDFPRHVQRVDRY